MDYLQELIMILHEHMAHMHTLMLSGHSGMWQTRVSGKGPMVALIVRWLWILQPNWKNITFWSGQYNKNILYVTSHSFECWCNHCLSSDIINSFTRCSRFLLEKLTVCLCSQIPAFYETQRFITVYESLPLVPVLRQINLLHTLLLYFLQDLCPSIYDKVFRVVSSLQAV